MKTKDKALTGFVFTFRYNDELRGGKAQAVFATSYGAARDIMFSRFGEDWAFQYELDAWLRDLRDPSYPVTLETIMPMALVQTALETETPGPYYTWKPYDECVSDD